MKQIAILLPLAAAALAAGPTTLKLNLPPWEKEGTPLPVSLPNLEKTNAPPCTELAVPEGARLLSRGAPVTLSDSFVIMGGPEIVTDGDKRGSSDYTVEMGGGQQYAQVDLGKPCRIDAVALWRDHRYYKVYKDVIVQVTADVDGIQGVSTVFNNDDDNSSGFGIGRDPTYFESNTGRLFPGHGVTGRYVRVYSNESTASPGNCVNEIEVYGRPIE